MIGMLRLVMAALVAILPVVGAAEAPAPGGMASAIAPAEGPPAFPDLLAEAQMRLDVPEGFVSVPVRPNPLFLYDSALASPDGAIEVRYVVRPLSRIVVDYDDPHSSVPDPNHMFPLMFQSMVTLLSNGRHSPTGEYPPGQARERFNADWAAAAVFDMSVEFDASQRQALVVAMHKNRLADAYAIFLFDDYQQVKPQIDQTLGALRFSR